MDEKIIRDARITEMTNMGAGVTKDSDGKTVFVMGGADGDVCDVKITSARSSFAFGVPTAIKLPSPHRITPDCAAFESGCGGCSFRHITYSHELEIKQNYVTSLLKRVGSDAEVERIFSAGEYEPRTKVTVPIGKDGSVGYYKGASHTIVPCGEICRIHSELTNRILSALNELPLGGRFHHVCLRHATHGTMLILIASKDESERANEIFEVLRGKFPEITSGYFCLRKPNEARGNFFYLGGDEKIHDILTGCDFAISPDAFYQVNHGSAERLYSLAAEFASVRDGETVADLYCGTGTIGISVLKNSGAKAKLYGIEIVESAVRDARENALANGIEAEFLAGDAATFDRTADVVIVDPPRAGCDAKLISHLKNTLPSRIVYISCEPATLARDIAALSDCYAVTRAATVDMFPRTAHVESVALLTRKEK